MLQFRVPRWKSCGSRDVWFSRRDGRKWANACFVTKQGMTEPSWCDNAKCQERCLRGSTMQDKVKTCTTASKKGDHRTSVQEDCASGGPPGVRLVDLSSCKPFRWFLRINYLSAQDIQDRNGVTGNLTDTASPSPSVRCGSNQGMARRSANGHGLCTRAFQLLSISSVPLQSRAL